MVCIKIGKFLNKDWVNVTIVCVSLHYQISELYFWLSHQSLLLLPYLHYLRVLAIVIFYYMTLNASTLEGKFFVSLSICVVTGEVKHTFWPIWITLEKAVGLLQTHL